MVLDYVINKTATLIISDLTGKEINRYRLVANKNKLAISETTLNKGIYFYTLQVGNQTHQGKVVKID